MSVKAYLIEVQGSDYHVWKSGKEGRHDQWSVRKRGADKALFTAGFSPNATQDEVLTGIATFIQMGVGAAA